MCENLAKKDHKELYPKFWKNSEWAKFFAFQCVLANRLLKKYRPEHIIKGIRECNWAYSLNTKKLQVAIAELAKKNVYAAEELIELQEAKFTDVRPPLQDNNIFDILG